MDATNGYYVILNRNALTMSKDIKSKGSKWKMSKLIANADDYSTEEIDAKFAKRGYAICDPFANKTLQNR